MGAVESALNQVQPRLAFCDLTPDSVGMARQPIAALARAGCTQQVADLLQPEAGLLGAQDDANPKQMPQVEARTGVFTDVTTLPMLTGLANVASASGAISPAEADSWLNGQRQRAASARLFVAVPVFRAAATRPNPLA